MSPEFSELFIRNEGIFSITEQQKLENKKVLIIGTGGVGGTVAIILARTGIHNFILVDFDTYDKTNTNRQICCYTDTIGAFKSNAIAADIKRINPKATVQSIPNLVSLEKIEELMNGVDAVMAGADDFAFSIFIEKIARRKNILTLLVVPAGTWAHVVITGKKCPSISFIEGIPEIDSYEKLKKIIHQSNFNHAKKAYTKHGSWSKNYFDRFIKGEVKLAQICPSVWLASALGARELCFALVNKKAVISPYYWEIRADRFIKKNAYLSIFSPSRILRKLFLNKCKRNLEKQTEFFEVPLTQ